MPNDVKDFILEVQKCMKIKKRISQFSQEATIYYIIREYKKMTEKSK